MPQRWYVQNGTAVLGDREVLSNGSDKVGRFEDVIAI